MNNSTNYKKFVSELSNEQQINLYNALYETLANQGTDGDRELAHVNASEMALLRAVGGSGTYNCYTGLRQFGGGKGGSSSQTTVEMTPEQRAFIQAQTDFFTNTIRPTYEQAVQGATDVYNLNAPGVTAAAQNQAALAAQAQETLGGVGESAYRTGVSGLENLFTPDYEANQIAAALAPAQAQYQQNVALQERQMGGAGQLGSARSALAARQLAGATQAQQAQTAAQVQANIAAQRAGVGQALAGIGSSGIGQAVGMAGQQVSAAMTPQQLYNQYASVIFGTPAASYAPDFRGTQNTSKDESNWNFGFKLF